MSDQIIFLGPQLHTLQCHQSSHARPIRHNTSRPFSSSTDRTSDSRSNHERPRRRRKQHSLVDETQLELSPLTKTKTPRKQATSSERKSVSSGGTLSTARTGNKNDMEVDIAKETRHTLEQNSLPQTRLAADDVISKESVPSYSSLFKTDKLRLGPARVVGMRRTNFGKPTLLKALEKPASRLEKRKAESLIRPGPRPLSDAGNRSTVSEDDGSLGGFTTVDSIPPPPTHAFSLSHLTSIASLLSSPNRFLSSYQGGSQHETAYKFNLLVLVVRVSGLEDAPDWKAGMGRRMDRCEIVVKDSSACSIKVILERDCASIWTSPNDSSSLDSDTFQTNSVTEESQLSETNSERYANSLEAQDDSTTASRTTIERQKNNRLFPLRPGDVIVLSRLILTRPRPGKQQGRPSSFAPKTSNTYAVASPLHNSQVEICWRSSIRSEEDKRRNFDKSLTTFDARCKAIYLLAQMWSPSIISQ